MSDAERGAATDVTTGYGPHHVRGTVRIAPRVLMELIELTVIDIEGVAALQPLRRRSAREAPEGGKSFSDGTVRVGIVNDRINADIAISVVRGTNLTALSRAIQRRVALAVGHMLGMTVTEVNIYIDDIRDADAAASYD